VENAVGASDTDSAEITVICPWSRVHGGRESVLTRRTVTDSSSRSIDRPFPGSAARSPVRPDRLPPQNGSCYTPAALSGCP
jgi:hypothetical protein